MSQRKKKPSKKSNQIRQTVWLENAKCGNFYDPRGTPRSRGLEGKQRETNHNKSPRSVSRSSPDSGVPRKRTAEMYKSFWLKHINHHHHRARTLHHYHSVSSSSAWKKRRPKTAKVNQESPRTRRRNPYRNLKISINSHIFSTVSLFFSLSCPPPPHSLSLSILPLCSRFRAVPFCDLIRHLSFTLFFC